MAAACRGLQRSDNASLLINPREGKMWIYFLITRLEGGKEGAEILSAWLTHQWGYRLWHSQCFSFETIWNKYLGSITNNQCSSILQYRNKKHSVSRLLKHYRGATVNVFGVGMHMCFLPVNYTKDPCVVDDQKILDMTSSTLLKIFRSLSLMKVGINQKSTTSCVQDQNKEVSIRPFDLGSVENLPL